MNRVADSSQNSWQPVMTANTTDSQYWLNWRVALCSIWILLSVIISLVLIWKHESFGSLRDDSEETQQQTTSFVCKENSWRPCLKEIHPAWLLAFRILAFCILVPLLIVYTFVDGGGIFHYYTQWTFTLVTIYFGIGIALSMYGCFQFLNKVAGQGDEHLRPYEEQSMYAGPANGRHANRSHEMKIAAPSEEQSTRQSIGIWGYAFQIIYQTCAGAVVLTDTVFWLIIFPFLAFKDYSLNFLLIVMHSMNAIFLLGDAALNCLSFPWFRISYFVLWTAIYVAVQWIIHACVSLWWPYPFLDLSSPYAPLWYLVVALLHVPCYAIFALVIKMKHHYLSRRFPNSYQCLRYTSRARGNGIQGRILQSSLDRI